MERLLRSTYDLKLYNYCSIEWKIGVFVKIFISGFVCFCDKNITKENLAVVYMYMCIYYYH